MAVLIKTATPFNTLVFNKFILDFKTIAKLDYFFSIHDPTTVNRQGNDIGESYRSAIFYENDEQLKTAEAAIVRTQKHWPRQIVTKLEKLIKFHSAENHHQDYIIKNPGGYTCHFERY